MKTQESNSKKIGYVLGNGLPIICHCEIPLKSPFSQMGNSGSKKLVNYSHELLYIQNHFEKLITKDVLL